MLVEFKYKSLFDQVYNTTSCNVLPRPRTRPTYSVDLNKLILNIVLNRKYRHEKRAFP